MSTTLIMRDGRVGRKCACCSSSPMRALLDAEKHGSWYADLTTVAVTLRVVDEISRAAYEIKAKNVYAMQRNAGPILVIPTAHKLRLNWPKEGLDAEKVKWKYSLSGTVLRLIELWKVNVTFGYFFQPKIRLLPTTQSLHQIFNGNRTA